MIFLLYINIHQCTNIQIISILQLFIQKEKIMSEIEPSMQKKRYIILIAGVIIQFCAGIIYMWSIFVDPVTLHLDWDKPAVKLTASFMLVAFVAGILIGGRIMDKIGPKITCLSGALIMSAGILASSLVTSSLPELMYVTYGLIGGFGVGVVYTCTVSPIQKWFFDKKGFATGVMVGAFGFSLVIFAPLAEFLLGDVGVPSTFLIFGAAFLIVCIPASLLITNPSKEYLDNLRGPMAPSKQRQYKTKEMLRTKSFYLITFSLFFVLPAFFILNPMISTLGVERGLSTNLATGAVMITGACSASGRLFITWISDKIGRMMSLFFIAGTTIIGSLIAIIAQDVFFLVCVAIIAFAFGGAAGIYATVTSDHFGAQNMGSNYGFVMLGFGASALIFPLISTQLTSDGDYTMSFVLAALTCVAAIICILLLRTQKAKDTAIDTA